MGKGFATAFSRRSLAFQLTLLVLVMAIPLLVLAQLMYRQLVDNERESIRQGLLSSARTLAALVDSEIDTHLALAAGLARSPTLQRQDLVTFWNEAKAALEFLPGSWIVVNSPAGQMLVNTLLPPNAALSMHVAPELVRRALDNRRPQVSDLVFGPASQRWTPFAEVPVYRDGAPLYSLSVTFPPERFLALIKTRFTRNEVVAIIDRNRRFVARIPDHETRLGSMASEGWRAAIDRSAEGWTENKTVEGDWSLTGYAATTHGWTVGVARLESDMARPLAAILWTNVLLGSGLTLLGLLCGLLVARHASRGMAELAAGARHLVDGEAITELRAPFAEAHTIAEALAWASAELKRRGDRIAADQIQLEATIATRTEELRDEIQRRNETEKTLRQVQKMDSIGQLTGGIAHDFNNMLTIILGNLETAMRRLKSIDNAATLHRPLDAATQGARNAAKLTRRLLAFARQQPLEPVILDLNALVAGLSDMLKRTVGENIQVETVAAAGLWTTFVDANEVENALINMAVNARDAMPEGGKLTIETSNVFLDDAYVSRFGNLAAGQYVMLSISDTGMGIPADILDRVFEPFYTTKESGKGTGLGLSMVHGFVSQSKGHMRIYSEVGLGTTVKMYLPRHMESVELPASPRPDIAIPRLAPQAIGDETILLVEDDAGVREYAVGALQDLGYRVLPAAGGAEALRIAEKPGRLDLLFTDVVLGEGNNGKQLAEQILKHRPGLPVLFTTGYTRNAIVHHGRLDPGVNLLNKPYTLGDLAEKVRYVLDRASPRSS
ncbi:ATP-binding protein [Bradyrhizobium sp.]|uniref:ATP-binding protein n=1 Tax=Bradyrhizobium sp. TaxID=376 RepID=UPI0025B9C9D8|nr:ATP-binding protein [Bradyrhizobium sp.]